MIREFKGDLQEIDPKRLINPRASDDFENFFLTVGLIFNDLKGLTILDRTFREVYRPLSSTELEVSPHAGEFAGISTQIYKLYAGIINEFIDFLEKNSAVINTHEFNDIVNKLPFKIKARWFEIVNIAESKRKKTYQTSAFATSLMLIRHNVGYHYFQSGDSLRQSFVKRFFEKPKDVSNRRAYYSLGTSMQDTRFYYVDAAVQEYIFGQARSSFEMTDDSDALVFNKHLDSTFDFISDMNDILFNFLKRYLTSRPSR